MIGVISDELLLLFTVVSSLALFSGVGLAFALIGLLSKSLSTHDG
jgi:hypothetical protein